MLVFRKNFVYVPKVWPLGSCVWSFVKVVGWKSTLYLKALFRRLFELKNKPHPIIIKDGKSHIDRRIIAFHIYV